MQNVLFFCCCFFLQKTPYISSSSVPDPVPFYRDPSQKLMGSLPGWDTSSIQVSLKFIEQLFCVTPLTNQQTENTAKKYNLLSPEEMNKLMFCPALLIIASQRRTESKAVVSCDGAADSKTSLEPWRIITLITLTFVTPALPLLRERNGFPVMYMWARESVSGAITVYESRGFMIYDLRSDWFLRKPVCSSVRLHRSLVKVWNRSMCL